MLKEVYVLYSDFVLKNPFYENDMPIHCDKFDRCALYGSISWCVFILPIVCSMWRRMRPAQPAEPWMAMQGSLLTPGGSAATSSNSASAPSAPPVGGRRSVFTRMRSGLRSAFNLRQPRDGGPVEGDAALHATLQAERQRWAAERQMLLTDCTVIRAEAQVLTERLDGWSSLVRDLFFYGGLHDRVDAITHFLCARLRESVGEIDGVSEVEVSQLRPPP